MWTLVDIQWVTFLCNYIAIRAESWKKFWKCFSYYFTVRSLLRYEIYKSPPHRIIVVLCSGWFFECFYSPWCSIQICWEDSALLWVWVKRRSMGKLRSFGRKGRSKNCIIVRIVPPSTSNLVCKHGTEIFLFILIMCISSVPNFCESFAFGTVLHKNMIAHAHHISHFLSVETYFCIASLSSVHFDMW